MTPIESIYEIDEAGSTLQKYLHSKDKIVVKRARIKYEQLVDSFFREHGKYVKLEQRRGCLDDVDCSGSKESGQMRDLKTRKFRM